MIAALLLALLVDATRSRARAQELSGRLGAAPRQVAAPGTLARLLWVQRQYGPDVRQAVELCLMAAHVSVLENDVENPNEEWDFGWSVRGGFEDVPRRRQGDRHVDVSEMLLGPDGFSVLGLGDPEVWLARPRPGTRTAIDPLIPWVAATVDRVRRARTVAELDLTLRGHPRHVPRRWMAMEHLFRTDPYLEGGEGAVLRDARTRAWIAGWMQGDLFDSVPGISVLDYLESDPPADLLRLTWADLVARSDAWHRDLRGAGGFMRPAAPGLPVARWPDGARLERLVTPGQLLGEGEAMGHCVGGYWASVRDGTSVILSYRDADGVSRATAEVGTEERSSREGGPSRVRQLMGPEDHPVEEGEVFDRVNLALQDLGAQAGNWSSFIVVPEVVVRVAASPREDEPWGVYRDTTPVADRPMGWSRARALLGATVQLHAARETFRLDPDTFWNRLDAQAEELRRMVGTSCMQRSTFWPTKALEKLRPEAIWQVVIPGPWSGGRGRWAIVAWWCDEEMNEPVIRVWRSDHVTKDNVDLFAAHSDRDLVDALHRAGVLVTPDERRAEIERLRASAPELLVPADLALGPIWTHLRAVEAGGRLLRPDERRLLRGAP